MNASGARISLLDRFSIEFAPPAQEPKPTGNLAPSAQRLLAHLGLYGARARSAVAGALWPDVPEEQAQGSLRTTLWRLQKVAPGLVDCSQASVRLVSGVAVDVQEVEAWARQVFEARTDVLALRTPRSALHGELLPGWYQDWVLVERERLRQLRLHALEVLSVRLADVGHFAQAVEAADAAVVAEPLRESAQRALITVHIAEGNLLEGLRRYDAYRALLADELGVPPTPLMDALVHPLLRGRRPALSSAKAHLRTTDRPRSGRNRRQRDSDGLSRGPAPYEGD
ncbi:BTAD domain-containing putative transcriptional regulator [Nocardioides sp.]|uniref:AfsR/SARP family transcriptional regulator n=1 Tax=Nocardioides sp. TaxID=35761 RepID=UPI0031FE6681|nr:putative DNA-binding transcriptional activator of the family [Nocardioides sp.]